MIIPDETGSMEKLGAYMNADVVLTLPEGKTVADVMWLSIWCEQAVVSVHVHVCLWARRFACVCF